jgi:tripartite-type tricarboxylate transporter receptor subunit TctC
MLPAAAMLAHTLGTDFRPVHFDGSGDVMLAGMRGDIDALIASWPSAIKGVRDSEGKMIPLFVVSEERVSSLADVPTLAEMGVEPDPAFYAVGSVSRALAAPRGLPSDVRATLVSAIERALADPELRQAMTNAGFEVVTASSAELDAKLAAATTQFAAASSLLEPASHSPSAP